MDWKMRIILQKDLKDSIRNDAEGKDFTPVDEIIDTFKAITTDMINLHWYFLDKGIKNNLILSSNYVVSMSFENELVLSVQIDIARLELMLNSKLGMEVLDYKKAMNNKYTDERLYQHAMSTFNEVVS